MQVVVSVFDVFPRWAQVSDGSLNSAFFTRMIENFLKGFVCQGPNSRRLSCLTRQLQDRAIVELGRALPEITKSARAQPSG
jgi:hypothetical protein